MVNRRESPVIPVSSAPIRITSRNPLREAHASGAEVVLSRAMVEVKQTILRTKFRKIEDQVQQAIEAEDDRECRIDGLLVRTKWMCEAIGDGLTTLAAMPEAPERRDALVREATTELTSMAELSTGHPIPHTDWRAALTALQTCAEEMIASGGDDAASLTEIDLVMDRLERAETLVVDALKSYFGYLSA